MVFGLGLWSLVWAEHGSLFFKLVQNKKGLELGLTCFKKHIWACNDWFEVFFVWFQDVWIIFCFGPKFWF